VNKISLKTFNLDEEAYREFSKHCKDNGISMSKKVDKFIKGELKVLRGGGKREHGGHGDRVKGKDDRDHPMEKYC
jgi:hypothetical protein